MSDTVLHFYKGKYEGYSEQLKNLKSKQRIFVFFRLATFLLMIFLPLIFIATYPLLSLAVFITLLATFLFLVKRFIDSERQANYITSLVKLNSDEIERLRGNLAAFEEGNNFSQDGHQYSLDLDIFGHDSLFQYINRCTTSGGKAMLSCMLLEPSEKPEDICRRQKAYAELSDYPEFCQQFIATGMTHKESHGDWQALKEFVNSPSRFTRNYFLVIVSKLLPALIIGLAGLAVAGILPFYPVIVIFLIQLGITGMNVRHVNEIHAKVTRRLDSLRKYSDLLNLIQTASFGAPLLKSLQRYLKTNGKPPSVHIKSLTSIVDALDNRLNFIAIIFLNGLFMWDVNCVLRLEKWNRTHRKQVPVWLESISRMEAFISFSVYTFNNPFFVFPRPVNEGPVLYAVGLGHPLIHESERVCNNFSVDRDGSFVIITGANMAGKSTFLRTAGIAMVLAMAGAPVCAELFHFRIMEVYTSMRTSDSLSRNESYFYAELKRLKDLIERLESGKKVFVILDEILKGTNSIDKQKGSIALIQKMIGLGATGIVATHDLSLTSLDQVFPERIKNKCFEVDIEGEQIKFDYRLREGITSKMNALILMKQMGLLPDEHLSEFK
jgi:hypothetical protein